MRRLTLIVILSLLGIQSQTRAGNLRDAQQSEAGLLSLWVFEGAAGQKVEEVEDLSGALPLKRPAGSDGTIIAEIESGPAGTPGALKIPAPESPTVGGGLETKGFDWPREGTVEFLIKSASSGGPEESGMAISGLSLTSRWYVFQSKAGEPVRWWVGGGNPTKRPDLIGGTSPVDFQQEVWYYVALQYRFHESEPTCELVAYVADLNAKQPTLQKVAELTVATVSEEEAGQPVDPNAKPLISKLNLGCEANGQGFRWYGSLANIAMYEGWLGEARLKAHLATLGK